jgi:outer membrane protein
VVASAEEDYRVAKVRYEAGKSVNVEVIDAQSALVRARANYIDALYDFNVALDRLERAVGSELPSSTEPPGV